MLFSSLRTSLPLSPTVVKSGVKNSKRSSYIFLSFLTLLWKDFLSNLLCYDNDNFTLIQFRVGGYKTRQFLSEVVLDSKRLLNVWKICFSLQLLSLSNLCKRQFHFSCKNNSFVNKLYSKCYYSLILKIKHVNK